MVADSNRTKVVRPIKAEVPAATDNIVSAGVVADEPDMAANTDQTAGQQDTGEPVAMELTPEQPVVTPHQDIVLPSAINQSANENVVKNIMPQGRASSLPGSPRLEQKKKESKASLAAQAEAWQLPVPDLEMDNMDAVMSSQLSDHVIAANQVRADEETRVMVVSGRTNQSLDMEPANHMPLKTAKTSLPSADELDRLVANFIGSYNEGDLAEFMNLMDEDLRTDEPGGKAALRQAYMQIFRESRIRELELLELTWQRNGDTMVGSSAYLSQLTSRRDGATRTTRGHLRLEVSKQAAGPRISGFYQMAEKGKR